MKQITPFKDNKPCADALIVEHGYVLLVRRAEEPYMGLWALPGGHCEFGEHPRNTAHREAKEETNLDVIIGDIFDIYLDLVTSDDCRQVTVYRATVDPRITPVLAPSFESYEVGWHSLEALPPLSPLAGDILGDYLP